MNYIFARKLFFLVLLWGYSSPILAFVELGLNYGYSKQVYGADREVTLLMRKYSGSLAIYIWGGVTGLELNYSDNQDILTDESDVDLGNNTEISSVRKRTRRKIYGAGLRQAFAGQKSFLIPVLSVGYAKQFEREMTTYTVISNGERTIIDAEETKRRYDSMFGTFMLKIRLSRFFSISGSAKTYFRAFEFNEAKYNISYSAGLVWIF